MKKVIIAFVLAAIVGMTGYAVFAAPTVTISSSQGTPYYLFAVTTGANVTVAVPDNDILILHTGVQSDGTTASAATDYVTVMDAFAADGTTGTSMVASYAAGAKLNIKSGAAFTFRGCDSSFGTVDGVRQIIIKAVGNGAMVQIVKGSKYGSGQ